MSVCIGLFATIIIDISLGLNDGALFADEEEVNTFTVNVNAALAPSGSVALITATLLPTSDSLGVPDIVLVVASNNIQSGPIA